MVFNFDKLHVRGHEHSLGLSIALNEIRNVLITPAGYLFGGKTVTSYRFRLEDSKTHEGFSHCLFRDFQDSYPTKSLFKTLIAITCLVPSIFAYLLICPLVSCLEDSRLRWNAFQEYKKDPEAFSKVYSKIGAEQIVHERSAFVELKDKMRLAMFDGYIYGVTPILQTMNLDEFGEFTQYYASLPFEERAAPVARGGSPYEWRVVKTEDLRLLRQNPPTSVRIDSLTFNEIIQSRAS